MPASRLAALAKFQVITKYGPVLVHAGDVVPARSAIVKGRERLFVAVDEYVQTDGTPPSA
jgi:hypothetical protein